MHLNSSSKLLCAALVASLAVATSGRLGTAHAQSTLVPQKAPVGMAAAQLNCAGESAFRIEVERPRDLQVSMSRPAGASSWNTLLMVTGKVATLDRGRSCGTSTHVQVTADEADARTALQTCAVMGAGVGAGQHLVINMRLLDRARAGAGSGLMLTKPAQIDCGVE